MVESKLVELVVAGSSPVGHPTIYKLFNDNTLLNFMRILSDQFCVQTVCVKSKYSPRFTAIHCAIESATVAD
jgi:hypothetical protein